MASDLHGIARTSRNRTEEQKLQELDKINKYRELEDSVRSHIAQKSDPAVLFPLTSRLLRLNPEYYTVWNVRRRCLTSGLLSAPSAGSSRSTAWPSSSRTVTTTTSSAASSSSASATIQPSRVSRLTGKSGSIADGDGTATASAESTAANAGGEEGEEEEGEKEEEENANAAQDDPAQKEGQDLEILRSELGFTIPLLLEYPKCYWLWNHRRWLLQQAVERLSVPTARRIWEEELGLVAKMLMRDRRNFHAWSYRRYVVMRLESPELEGRSMVEPEFEYTTRMIRADLSNFSAWHNRTKLISRLLDERNADGATRKSFYDAELALVREALNVGPDDQSLWYYHHFLVLNLTRDVAPSAEANRSQRSAAVITPDMSQEERVRYLAREIEDTREFLDDYDDVKWIYEVLVEYTLALYRLERRPPNDEERAELRAWLAKLRTLDPMRNGRWADLEREHGLA